jgi:hypothetical protein
MRYDGSDVQQLTDEWARRPGSRPAGSSLVVTTVRARPFGAESLPINPVLFV